MLIHLLKFSYNMNTLFSQNDSNIFYINRNEFFQHIQNLKEKGDLCAEMSVLSFGYFFFLIFIQANLLPSS